MRIQRRLQTQKSGASCFLLRTWTRATVSRQAKALVDAKIEFATRPSSSPGRRREHLADRDQHSLLGRSRSTSGMPRPTTPLDRKSRNRGSRAKIAVWPSRPRRTPQMKFPRSAAVSLSFTDGWDETVSVEFNLLQRTAKETLGRRSHSEEFRRTYAMNKKVEDYVILEGIVVSNTKNHNAGENTQARPQRSTTAYRTGPSTSKPTTANTGSPSRPPRPKTTSSEQYDHVQIPFRAPRATWSRPRPL